MRMITQSNKDELNISRIHIQCSLWECRCHTCKVPRRGDMTTFVFGWIQKIWPSFRIRIGDGDRCVCGVRYGTVVCCCCWYFEFVVLVSVVVGSRSRSCTTHSVSVLHRTDGDGIGLRFSIVLQFLKNCGKKMHLYLSFYELVIPFHSPYYFSLQTGS